MILEARTAAERVRNAPAAIDTLSEAEMNVIREVLRGVLLIPGAVIAAFSAFGHLGGVQEIAARALSTDEALNLLQSIVDHKLERLIDRMRFADYGYAAVFDRVQLGDAELTKIYQYDSAIMAELGKFEDEIADIEQSGTDVARLRSGLAKLDALTAEFDRRFEGRKHLFDGLPTP